jgi:hypothetical protein
MTTSITSITSTDLPTADGIARAWLDADADDSFGADLAKGRADRTAARQWATARAFSYETALADY